MSVVTIVYNGALYICWWLQCRLNLLDLSYSATSTTETTFPSVVLSVFPDGWRGWEINYLPYGTDIFLVRILYHTI